MEKKSSTNSIGSPSSRDLAVKTNIICSENPVEWESKMNVCLQGKLDEINKIVQAQEKLASIGTDNYNELKQVNDELQEKLRETEKQNDDLKRELEETRIDNPTCDREEATSLNPLMSTHDSNQPCFNILGLLRAASNRSGILIYNTQSIHMYAIYVTTTDTFNSNRWRYAQSWLVAIVSFLVIIWQILILFFLILNLEFSPDVDPCLKFRIDVQFNLVFLLFLFAVILGKDIEETAIEQAIFDSRAIQIVSHGQQIRIQAQLVRFSLRIQRYTFPYYVGATVFFVLTAESPSVAYTLLNLLTVGFVTSIDRFVSAFFLTHDQRASTDKLVHDIQQHDGDVIVSLFWSRIFGLAATTMIFGLTEFFENGLDDTCNFFLSDTLSFLMFTIILPVFTILVPSLTYLSFDRTRCKNVSRALVEFIRNTIAYCFVIILTIIVMKVSLGEEASSLFNLGIYLQAVWFWLIVALLVVSLILCCVFLRLREFWRNK